MTMRRNATERAVKALDTGSPGALVAVITADVERGIRQRFARAAAAKRRAHEHEHEPPASRHP
jgi:hypothetical protein